MSLLFFTKYKKWKNFLKWLSHVYYGICFLGLDWNRKEHKIKPSSYGTVREHIKPGDVVMRAFPKSLISIFIAGEKDHSGIYVGDDLVAHAVAGGVTIEPLIDFLMTDKVWIMRYPRNLTPQEIIGMQSKAKSLEGTPYDYSFNSGIDKLYCHEFTKTCFDHIEDSAQYIKPSKSLGKKVYLESSFESFVPVLEM